MKKGKKKKMLIVFICIICLVAFSILAVYITEWLLVIHPINEKLKNITDIDFNVTSDNDDFIIEKDDFINYCEGYRVDYMCEEAMAAGCNLKIFPDNGEARQMHLFLSKGYENPMLRKTFVNKAGVEIQCMYSYEIDSTFNFNRNYFLCINNKFVSCSQGGVKYMTMPDVGKQLTAFLEQWGVYE